MKDSTNINHTTLPTLQRNNNLGTEASAKTAKANANQQTWEDNHAKISDAIVRLTNKKKRIPLQSEIARECGMSRRTVAKHMCPSESRLFFDQQLKHFNYMGGVLLAKIIQMAMEGDMRAAKLYFDILHKQSATASQSNTFTEHRHESLLVNKTFIHQQQLDTMDPDSRRDIEDIVMNELAKADEQERIIKARRKYGLGRQPIQPESIHDIRCRNALAEGVIWNPDEEDETEHEDTVADDAVDAPELTDENVATGTTAAADVADYPDVLLSDVNELLTKGDILKSHEATSQGLERGFVRYRDKRKE